MDRRDESCLNEVRYDSREDALRSYKGYRIRIQRNRGRRVNKDKNKQHPYKCELCNGWHLTTPEIRAIDVTLV